MVLPILPILTSAIGKFVVSKLNPKEESVSLGEAVVGEAVTRLMPPNPTGTNDDGWYDGLVVKAGREFGETLLRVIKPGKWEKIGECVVGRFFRAAADKLDPQ